MSLIDTVTPDDTLHFSLEYKELLVQIKDRVRSARHRAAIAVNSEVIKLYWYIGTQIIERQQTTTRGSKLVEALSKDLRQAFPETSGFSAPNLKRMRLFAQAFPDPEIGSQTVIQLPWGHILTIIHRVKEINEREWYIQ